jgi:hypothetical protein
MQTEDRMQKARKRVEEIKGLYVHMLVYALVNIGLFAMDAVTSTGIQWAYWPALGWGVGLAIHVSMVIVEGRFGPDWEERQARKLLERDALHS